MSNENLENKNKNKNESQIEERNLDTAQKDQRKVGGAAANPETTGPAENLREKAAEMNDNEEDKSEEPA